MNLLHTIGLMTRPTRKMDWSHIDPPSFRKSLSDEIEAMRKKRAADRKRMAGKRNG